MKPKVLIVDDTEANLIALEAQLSRMDCDIVRASSGSAALRLLLKHSFAVVLLDVQMSEMDGYEVAALARGNASTRDVPIIFVTAMHETEANALKGYGAGAVDYLFKPFNPDILVSKVQVFLDLYNGKQKLSEEIAAHKLTLAELDAFNYSVSHDLRAPLRPIDGFSQILIEDYGPKLDDEGRKLLERIRSAAKRMSELIDDLLQLSRTSRADMHREPLDLTLLSKQILAELQNAEPTRAVTVVLPERCLVQADRQLLRIVLENLLRNAWKFTSKKPAARIEVGLTTEGEQTSYFVRDDGAGFDAANAHRLFQPFQRLHLASEYDGTGIGLAIVNRIVHRHGGTVWAKSAVGEGATFHFTLAG